MATYDLGQFQMRLRGTYSASTTYNFLDVVYYNGGSYCCKTNSTSGKLPTNTTYWQQIAAAGQSTLTPEQKAEIVAALTEQQGIVIDPDYNQFTIEEKEKLAGLNSPNNGTLTIKRNNVVVGSFSADQGGNVTLNIAVPTSIGDLNGHDDLYKSPSLIASDSTSATLSEVKPNTIYHFREPLTSLAVSSLSYDMNDASYLLKQPTVICFIAGASFAVAVPQGGFSTSLEVTAGRAYRLIIHGMYFNLEEYLK